MTGEQEAEMRAALKKARDVLRLVATDRQKHGAVATAALSAVHQINFALALGESPPAGTDLSP